MTEPMTPTTLAADVAQALQGVTDLIAQAEAASFALSMLPKQRKVANLLADLIARIRELEGARDNLSDKLELERALTNGAVIALQRKRDAAEAIAALPAIVPQPAPRLPDLGAREAALREAAQCSIDNQDCSPWEVSEAILNLIGKKPAGPHPAEAEVSTLRARLARMEGALRDIAKQKKTTELETEYDVEGADFEGGYDTCIDVARAALTDGGSNG